MTDREHELMVVMFGLQHRILRQLIETLHKSGALTDADVKQMDYVMTHPESYDNQVSDKAVLALYQRSRDRLPANTPGEAH